MPERPRSSPASWAGNIRRPTMHALDAAIFLGSLAIVWLGLSPAHT
jgi:hypothetical protein